MAEKPNPSSPSIVETEPHRQLTTISAASWENKDIEPQQWLVSGMIPMLTTTSLAGDGGLGKSLLAMQLMTCCGAGKRFLNKDTQQVTSIGLFCEDRENQLHERQQKINEYYELSYKDVVDVNYMPRVGEDNAIVTSSYEKPTFTPFYKDFRECVLDIGAKLCVIDTAADTFMGNENIRAQVRYYVQLLNGLASDMQGAVLLLVHPSIAGLASGSGTSGSTAWSNSVRSRWYLEKQKEQNEDEPDDNIRILSQKKSNYSAVDSQGIVLKWDEGAFKIKLDDNDAVSRMRDRKIARDFIALMKVLEIQNRPLSISPKAYNYAPKIIRENLESKISIGKLEKTMNYLLSNDYIKNESYDRASRGTYRLIVVKDLEP